MYCSKCGKENVNSDNFCGNCGYEFQDVLDNEIGFNTNKNIIGNTQIDDNHQDIASNITINETNLSKWNWGAFVFTWLWGIFNKSYKTLLTIIPIFGVFYLFVCGAKGTQWAYNNRVWKSDEHFNKSMSRWNNWAIFFIFLTIIIPSMAIMFSMNGSNSINSSEEININSSEEVIIHVNQLEDILPYLPSKWTSNYNSDNDYYELYNSQGYQVTLTNEPTLKTTNDVVSSLKESGWDFSCFDYHDAKTIDYTFSSRPMTYSYIKSLSGKDMFYVTSGNDGYYESYLYIPTESNIVKFTIAENLFDKNYSYNQEVFTHVLNLANSIR